MNINGMGAAGYPAAGRAQKNSSGIGFASRMADMVDANASASSRETNAVSGHDNYVGGDATSIYDMLVYSRKDISTSQDLKLPVETERVDRQESKTKTEIIVQPDGSRVLVMTMSIGGMETTMSLEISKPTEAPNENSKRDTDNNNMPSDDAEMDTVSESMEGSE